MILTVLSSKWGKPRTSWGLVARALAIKYARRRARVNARPELSAYGVGETLDEALADLRQGVRALLGDGPIPDELTGEIEVIVGDAA